MMELIFQKELILTKQIHQKNAIFVIIDQYFKDIGIKYEPYLCNGCHSLMQKAMNFNNVAIACVKGSAYRIHFWCMSKDDAINIMNNYLLIKLFIYFK